MGAMFVNNDQQVKAAFTGDAAALNLGGSGPPIGVLVQGFNFTWQQAVNRLFEIGESTGTTHNVYHVLGRAQGQAGLQRVIGPGVQVARFYQKYSDVCEKNNMTFKFEPKKRGDLCKDGKLTYTLKFCVLTNVGISVQAQDMLVNEQSQLIFSGCDVEG